MLKILGRFCTGCHFLVVDPGFVKDIKQFDKQQTQFKIRKLTIGPDFADLIRLEKPPPHPCKNNSKRLKMSKEERETAKGKEEAQF